jgi:hypothetical protein
MEFRLLNEFRGLFEGRRYLHRNSSLGDWVALHLFEDLVALGRSSRLLANVEAGRSVVALQNKARGIKARRGDGTFGELIPGQIAIAQGGFAIRRGPVATVEIGAEVKILAKAMIKQIGRVKTVLGNQVAHFNKGGGKPICVAIVGINHAQVATSYEGDRIWKTDGSKHKHPYQEANEAERRLRDEVSPLFDEFVVLRFRARNEQPYPFEWVDRAATDQDYGASLVRVSRLYDERFAHL